MQNPVTPNGPATFGIERRQSRAASISSMSSSSRRLSFQRHRRLTPLWILEGVADQLSVRNVRAVEQIRRDGRVACLGQFVALALHEPVNTEDVHRNHNAGVRAPGRPVTPRHASIRLPPTSISTHSDDTIAASDRTLPTSSRPEITNAPLPLI